MPRQLRRFQVAARSRVARRQGAVGAAAWRRGGGRLPEVGASCLARLSVWRGAIRTITRCAGLRYAITSPRTSRFFAKFRRKAVQLLRHASTPSPQPAPRMRRSTRRRDRVGNERLSPKCRTDGRALRARSYSTRAASQMVSRAENRPLGIFSALFAYFFIFIRTKRVSPDFEPALVGHSWAQTDFARYLPTRRAPGVSLMGFERTGVA